MTTTKARPEKKSGLKRTTIFLNEEHHEALRKIAFERRTSMARLIREAVLEMLEDDEDIKEGMKTLAAGDEDSVTLEEYHKFRSEGKE